MDVHFVVPDLRKLDQLAFEAMFVPFFADERPLRGALGLLDWRLGGRVSRMIQGGRVVGSLGETTLVPSDGKLSVEKLFLRGMGECAEFTTERFDTACGAMLRTLTRTGVRSSLMVLPGRALEQIAAADAMERFLRVSKHHPEHDDVTIVEPAAAQREMEPVLLAARRTATAYG